MQFTVINLLIAILLIFETNYVQVFGNSIVNSNNVGEQSDGNLINSKEFYKSKEFHELLKEFNIKVDIKTLPDFNDVMILLGTTNIHETVQEIRKIASTKDGMELIRLYLGPENDDKLDDYITTAGEQKVSSESWWKRVINWLGFEQTTKIDPVETDVKIVPTPTSFANRFVYVRKFLNPDAQQTITTQPPFRNFESQSDGFEKLPVIRLTESQYNQMVKASRRSDVNTQRPLMFVTSRPTPTTTAKALETTKEITRTFSEKSLPIRVSYDFDSTGSIHKANPNDVSVISRRLSESSD
ncbi:hypothetical protein PVAND_000596 [Polypedilum vanderplanki]|uniref:Uncharacterized protein n=1 Tax=Polypedilum vanderplanki TaxID=319348 RepID=A0A9J6BKS7_POLVA|nr:hypothetical protein PVAND_000596 [Polypedilum vanderplanki]